jgi:hypothetical protein
MKVLFRYTLRILLLFVFFLGAQAQDSTRVLLRPPEKIPTSLINGKKYVKGEVYLSKTADPEILKPLGFRDVSFFVSASRYHRYKAKWPLNLNLDSLPPEIVGVTYEGQNTDFSSTPIIWSGNDGPKIEVTCSGQIVVKNHDGGPFNRFGQAIPAYPDTTVAGEPYVKGTVFLSDEKDLDALRKLGFTNFREPWYSKFDDVSLEKYIAHWKSNRRRTEFQKSLQYETSWPLNLDLNKLPDSVITLISDQISRTASEDPKKAKILRMFQSEETK